MGWLVPLTPPENDATLWIEIGIRYGMHPLQG